MPTSSAVARPGQSASCAVLEGLDEVAATPKEVWAMSSRSTPVLNQRGSRRGVRDELLPVGAAGDGECEHGPDAAGVELVLEDHGLERGELLRHEHSVEAAERHLDLLVDAQ